MTVITPDEYRKKHSRCATCKYFVPEYTNGYTGMCNVKERLTKRTKGRFCKTYKFISFKED
nr:MAG TPA: HIGH-POTENTIAL IRON-SULFUR PROTEIN sulfur cluster, electron transport [Caudoviricetes sp.]